MEKLYYFSNWLYRRNIPFLPRVIMNIMRVIYSCSVPYQSEIGKGLKLGHGGLGIVINRDVKIGDNCKIGTGVVIGGSNKNPIVPILGDNVYLASGAKVIGAVKIGDNVVVGANSVVTKDIPSNSLVVGIPAKIIKNNIEITDYV